MTSGGWQWRPFRRFLFFGRVQYCATGGQQTSPSRRRSLRSARIAVARYIPRTVPAVAVATVFRYSRMVMTQSCVFPRRFGYRPRRRGGYKPYITSTGPRWNFAFSFFSRLSSVLVFTSLGYRRVLRDDVRLLYTIRWIVVLLNYSRKIARCSAYLWWLGSPCKRFLWH